MLQPKWFGPISESTLEKEYSVSSDTLTVLPHFPEIPPLFLLALLLLVSTGLLQVTFAVNILNSAGLMVSGLAKNLTTVLES